MNRFVNNRRTLYLILGIVLVSVFTLTIAYASLTVTLNIIGSAEVNAANWDIHLGNAKVDSGSVSNTVPIITSPTTATFTASLVNPGDYYQFTIDVINDGTIDAMIDSVIKTPELTTDQAKYLNYIVEYQNGESINTKQLVSAGSFVRLKIKVEFRKDISVSDLPSSSITLNMSFKVKYIQSDDSGVNIFGNGASGPYDVGNEVCFGTECFYIISSDDNSVTLLAKYNLQVGIITDDYGNDTVISNPTGIQDETMLGYVYNQSKRRGTTAFSSNTQKGTNYSDYNGSIVETYVNDYHNYLITQGLIVNECRLLHYDEIISLGCTSDYDEESDEWTNTCKNAPAWIYSTSYWLGDAYNEKYVWGIYAVSGNFDGSSYGIDSRNGVRPVIEVPKSEL